MGKERRSGELQIQRSTAAHLVVAGYVDARTGRRRHTVALFATADEAREAFVRLRQTPTTVWAEASRVDANGRLSVLCWFDESGQRTA